MPSYMIPLLSYMIPSWFQQIAATSNHSLVKIAQAMNVLSLLGALLGIYLISRTKRGHRVPGIWRWRSSDSWEKTTCKFWRIFWWFLDDLDCFFLRKSSTARAVIPAGRLCCAVSCNMKKCYGMQCSRAQCMAMSNKSMYWKYVYLWGYMMHILTFCAPKELDVSETFWSWITDRVTHSSSLMQNVINNVFCR